MKRKIIGNHGWEIMEKAIMILVPHGKTANTTMNVMTATRAVTKSCVNTCRAERRCSD